MGLPFPARSKARRDGSHVFAEAAWALLASAVLLPGFLPTALAVDPRSNLINGKFEAGLAGWQTDGEVHLATNAAANGKVSVIIGPGVGKLAQRVEAGGGEHLTASATVRAQEAKGWVFTLRFLDKDGRELMKVGSVTDMKPAKEDAGRFDHYMKAHPLTKVIEIGVSKSRPGGMLRVEQVSLNVENENGATPASTPDVEQAMRPFWQGKTVYDEAVLMLSENGKPGEGQVMFTPSRILAVRDYSLLTNYAEGLDYTRAGRKLICTPGSRMDQVREEDLSKGELAWDTIGGRQVMVTYEHEDAWSHPYPEYVGDGLPETMKKLKARAPLTIVAYGDSITHGVGESGLAHLPPFLPPWPELFVQRLKAMYHDEQVQLFNSAQSGADSLWARNYAGRMVASLSPDLVIVAFGQNDFWRNSAKTYATNITEVMRTVRDRNPKAEFVLVSTLRFDPAYTTNAGYWTRVGQYNGELKAMAGPGVQWVDMTTISEWIYAAKKPKDCLNDPLHPNDYLARWYAQSLAAAFAPSAPRAPKAGSRLTSKSRDD
jgi:lysophospholipase L1-like esterase